MSDAIEEKVFALIAKQAKMEPSEVKPDSTMADLNIPSLGTVELIFDIEDEFDINFPEDQDADFAAGKAQDLVDTVRKALAQKDGADD